MPASGVPRLAGCIVWTEGLAEDNSLAENVQRAPLHPWVNPRSEFYWFPTRAEGIRYVRHAGRDQVSLGTKDWDESMAKL